MTHRFHNQQSWLVLAALTAILGGCAIDRPRPTQQTEFQVPPESVPQLGLCRIWYADLPPEWQPPAMPCARAHTLAEKHGGRVIKAISPKSFQDGRTLSMDYGPSEFAGIAPEQLPPPGYCRPWYERLPAEQQPAPMTCARAEQLVKKNGGRVLYMPGLELK
ncbi:MAG: hypothetical protein OEO84_01645 [Betaproteobacteria bacterium]|nr:hypothetical protein [Betaproteobacteria bacterium]